MTSRMVEPTGYIHTQSVANTTWTIVHNRNVEAVVVNAWADITGVSTRVAPVSITLTNNTTCVLVFATAYAGKAIVI
jgi:hypothetical protein